MRAIIVNPKLKTVEEIQVKGKDLQELYKLIGEEGITTFQIDSQNTMYLDDIGLKRPNQHFFMLGGYPERLGGNGVIYGTTSGGEDKSASIGLPDVKSMVRFYKEQPVYDRMDVKVVENPAFTYIKQTSVWKSEGVLDD